MKARCRHREDNLHDYLGVRKFDFGVPRRRTRSGRSSAWRGPRWAVICSPSRPVVMPGKGNIIRTGSLGDVMKESVEAARRSVRRARCFLGITRSVLREARSTSTCPRAPFPKGRSEAGITMATTAFVSRADRYPGARRRGDDGRDHLRGEVTAIGGLKENCWRRTGRAVKTVMIPGENVKGPPDIPENVKNNLWRSCRCAGSIRIQSQLR